MLIVDNRLRPIPWRDNAPTSVDYQTVPIDLADGGAPRQAWYGPAALPD